jgi:hypothetical protein
MRSRNITPALTPKTNQLTLDFEPGLHETIGSLRECIAQGIYQRGLSNVAPSLNKAPGNLSVELSEDPTRRFSVDALEDYIAKFNDHRPIHYLISKFMTSAADPKAAAAENMMAMLMQLAPMMKKMGLV